VGERIFPGAQAQTVKGELFALTNVGDCIFCNKGNLILAAFLGPYEMTTVKFQGRCSMDLTGNFWALVEKFTTQLTNPSPNPNLDPPQP